MLLGAIFSLIVSSDGNVVVGGSENVVMAHDTVTSEVLWRREMPGFQALCIHGGGVVVPVNNSNTVVLDVTTGHQLYTLPSAGEELIGICVFDGLAGELFCFDCFLTLCIYLSTANKGSLEAG